MLCDSKTGSQAGGRRREEEVGGGSRTCGHSQPGRTGVQPEGVGGGGGRARHRSLKHNSGSEDLDEYFTRSSLRAHVITAFFSHDARLQDVSRGRCEVKAGGEGGRGGQICF